jgi:hypothetical protein
LKVWKNPSDEKSNPRQFTFSAFQLFRFRFRPPPSVLSPRPKALSAFQVFRISAFSPSSFLRHRRLCRIPHFAFRINPTMNLSWKRTLRTASSERFLAQREGRDVAAVDLHYLANGTVAGTVILLKEAGWRESDVPALLGSLDEDFLPDVDLDHGNLNYTVVIGEVLGNYEAEKNSKS